MRQFIGQRHQLQEAHDAASQWRPSERGIPQQVTDGPAENQDADAGGNALAPADGSHTGVQQQPVGVKKKSQQQKTIEPSERRFPAEPAETDGKRCGDALTLSDREADGLDQSDLRRFSGRRGIYGCSEPPSQADQVIRLSNPKGTHKKGNSAENEIRPLTHHRWRMRSPCMQQCSHKAPDEVALLQSRKPGSREGRGGCDRDIALRMRQ